MTANNSYAHLKSWDEITAYAADLRQSRDACSWALGDLALFACGQRSPVGGRPRNGSEAYTLSALAFAIGEDRPVLSALMANSEFWPPLDRESLPLNVSWRQCSEARRRSGWRPGRLRTNVQIEFARELLEKFADSPQLVTPRKPKDRRSSLDGSAFDGEPPEESPPSDFERACRALHNDVMGLIRIAPSPHARECVRQAASALAEALEPEKVIA